jgi:hypothetical protein
MKKIIFSVAYLTICFIGTLVILELIFPFLINKLPFKVYSTLGRDISILGQTSKRSVLPKDYIAIIGDSYALGLGDWKRQQVEANWLTTDPEQVTHIINRETGEDVIAFGKMGAGSISTATEAVKTLKYLNSLWAYKVEKPKKIIVYFYEGNDIYDNISDILFLFNKRFPPKEIYNESYFDIFLKKDFLEKKSLSQKSGFLDKFFVSKLLFESMKSNIKFFKSFLNNQAKKKSPIQERKSTLLNSNINRIRVGGKEIQLPIDTQGPPFVGKSQADRLGDIGEEYLADAVYLFEKSLLFLKQIFQDVDIEVVYIPSPLSIYPIISPVVIYEHWILLNKHMVVKSELIFPKSHEICKLIESVSKKYGFKFLDSGKYLKSIVTRGKLAHGPKDWTHFNKNGYEALSKGILDAFFVETHSDKKFGCT